MSLGTPVAHRDYAQRPLLLFWETTRACHLACRHCRASAQREPLPGELSTAEAHGLIETIASFGDPHPILILTGGDCLLRPDLFELLGHARELAIPVAVAPSVTPSLTSDALARLKSLSVASVSVSLDGSIAATHESIRGVEGHFAATLAAMDRVVESGLRLQVNTTVMAQNVDQLADIARLVRDAGARVWEVFFLIAVGRGGGPRPLTPAQCEDVCLFLTEVSGHDLVIRTVEGPFYRRVARGQLGGGAFPGPLGRALVDRLQATLGPAPGPAVTPPATTRDGNGILFISHDGMITPSGFLPFDLGNIRSGGLVDVYRSHPLLVDIRAGRLGGRCGRCDFRRVCGGSRARSYAETGDPLGEDPACIYQPGFAT